MSQFNVHRSNDKILAVETNDRQYRLNYCHQEGLSCLFSFAGNFSEFKSCPITNRDYPYEYPFKLIQINLENLGKVVDVGAGLGGFIPKLVAQKPKYKPVVIDPANYDLMAEMLEFSRPYIGSEHLARLDELISRCSTILDSSKVILYNTFLGEALKYNPELRGVADIVVDNFGPSIWPDTEKYVGNNIVGNNIVELLEMMLLKDGGSLFSYKGKICKGDKYIF